MPFYEFECEECGEFSLSRMISQREEPAQCISCGREASRVFKAPNFRLMSTSQYKAHAVNEKSQHEPKVSGHRCASGCGCGPRKVGAKQKEFSAFKTGRPNSRPWMLGH